MKKYLLRWLLKSYIKEARSTLFKYVIAKLKDEWIRDMKRRNMTPDEINNQLSSIFVGHGIHQE